MAVAAEMITKILVALLLVATAFTRSSGSWALSFPRASSAATAVDTGRSGLHGLTRPHGCPGTLYEHAAHVVYVAFHRAHLRHH